MRDPDLDHFPTVRDTYEWIAARQERRQRILPREPRNPATRRIAGDLVTLGFGWDWVGRIGFGDYENRKVREESAVYVTGRLYRDTDAMRLARDLVHRLRHALEMEQAGEAQDPTGWDPA